MLQGGRKQSYQGAGALVALLPTALVSIPPPPANAPSLFVLNPFPLILVAPMRKNTARRMVGAPLAGALVALVALLVLLPIALQLLALDPIPSTWRLACPRAMHPSHS